MAKAVEGLLVVGSGPAGVSAAVAYRDAGGDGPVRVLTADPDPPYERPPLSKDVLRGKAEPGDTDLHPAEFYRERGIELRLATPVRALLVTDHAVLIGHGGVVAYDACVLATGSAPLRPPIPGADLPHVHVLRSRRDASTLRDAAAGAQRAAVAGSGFIGCEAAASLAARGVEVTLITDEPHPHQARLGGWVAQRIQQWLDGLGVTLLTGDTPAHIERGTVHTGSGRAVPADLVLLATGVTPQAELADEAHLELDNGRISVDASMRTSRPDVLAAGDVAYAHHAAAGRQIAVEHWGDALAMGEVAGRVAAGAPARWEQAPGFWTTIGDRTMKYAAWGDGYDHTRVVEHPDDGFTVWYGKDGVVVGVLTYQADPDYERGQELVVLAAPWPEVA